MTGQAFTEAAANGGFTFLWAISLGQLITIGFSMCGFVGAAVAFIIKVNTQAKMLDFLKGQVLEIKKELINQRREQHDEQMKIREEILQMRNDHHRRLEDMLTGLYHVRDALKKDNAA